MIMSEFQVCTYVDASAAASAFIRANKPCPLGHGIRFTVTLVFFDNC